jgi:D-alanyl-D-alanine carboxypeptidase
MHFGKHARIWLAATLCILLSLPVSLNVYAAVGRDDHTVIDISGDFDEWPEGPELNSEAAYLLDVSSGEVLFQKNADVRKYPASITKVLTAYIVIQDCDLNETVTFSSNAINGIEPDAVSGDIAVGDQLTVRDCLYLLLLKSNNEAAMALAEHDAGTVEAFARKMNAQAKEFGATDSNFANPHGLYDEDHYVTAQDMAKIFWGCLQDNTFLMIDSTVNYRTAPVKYYSSGIPCGMLHGMFNPDLGEYYEYAVCGKTGHIRAAGYTLVTYARKDEQELLAVTLKADSRVDSYNDTEALFEYGFNEFNLTNLVSSIDDNAVSRQISDQIGEAVLDEYLTDIFAQYVTLPEYVKASDLTQTVEMDSGEGSMRTGTVTFSYNGNTYGSLGLRAEVTLPVAVAKPGESSISVVSVDGQDLPSGLRGTLVMSFLNTDAWLVVIALGFFIVMILFTVIVVLYAKEKRRLKELERKKRRTR